MGQKRTGKVKEVLCHNNFFGLIIIIFILKGVFYATVLTPVTMVASPDDVGHLSYIQYIVTEKELPVLGEVGLEQTIAKTSLSIDNRITAMEYQKIEIEEYNFDYENGRNWILQHPPLYYILGAIVYGAVSMFTANQAILLIALRLFSVLLGAITLIYIRKFNEWKSINPIISNMSYVLFVFFAPMQYFFANITNDSLLICLSVVSSFYLFRFFENESMKDFAVMIISCVAIMYTKYTGAVVVFSYVLIFVYHIFKKKGLLNTMVYSLKGGVLAGVLLIPLFWFNISNYGALFTTSTTFSENYDISFMSFILDYKYLSELYKNIVLLLGWNNWIRTSDVNYWFIIIILGCASVSYLLKYYSSKKNKVIAIIMCILTFAITYLIDKDSYLSLSIAMFTIIVVMTCVNKQIPIEEKIFLRYMYLMIFLTVGVFMYQHYQITLHRGSTGAMHGRYYYVLVYPWLYILTNAFSNIQDKWKRCILILILICTVLSEAQIINRTIAMWTW